MQRERRKFIPALPKELSDLCLSDEWQQTICGQQWLHDISTSDSKRILLFCAPRSLHRLAQADVWYGDGTFSVTPPFFTQVIKKYQIKLDFKH
jgi:hypothetical protein